MFLVPSGRIADIMGRKKVFAVGILVYTVAPPFISLNFCRDAIAFRIIQGIGGAMIFGTGVAILTSVFPLCEKGKVFGSNVASVYTCFPSTRLLEQTRTF